MIRFLNKEFLAGGVGFFLALFWTVEDGWHGKHRHDGEHFLGTLILDGGDDEFR